MVRLKEVKKIRRQRNVATFQFLMVRLKVIHQNAKILYQFLISIPYGAIKRQKKIQRKKKNMISIPYGAIKSLLDTNNRL